MDDIEGPQFGGRCDGLGESLGCQQRTAFYGEDLQLGRPAHQIQEVPVPQAAASHSDVGHMVERKACGRARDVVHVFHLQAAQLLQPAEGSEAQRVIFPDT